ncbi:MAG: metal-sulfur cluster assembly factor [Burkholderiaceae bacterium]|nr:metal-sulfur cluster assembly factor [Burkholderiaceae bacterium]
MDTVALTARLRQALQSVLDPEIGESIVDLGLVERIDAAPGEQRLSVVLVPTSATCPMSDLLIEDATAAAEQALPGGWVADVTLDFSLPWSPARMSPALQQRFGWSADAD